MARAVSKNAKIGYTIGAWVVALIIFFPILYTIITSLKTEQEAIAGFNLIPSFTLESYQTVQSQNDYFKPFMNSVILSVGSTILALIVAIPAAWAMAFSPTKHTKDILMWMLSTKMMPAVAVLVPIYLIFLRTGLMDSRIGLTVLLMLINLPIVVWMLYTYFREIPGEILEASSGRRTSPSPVSLGTAAANRRCWKTRTWQRPTRRSRALTRLRARAF